MRAKIRFKDKIIEIPDIEKCSGIKKFTGLMFKSRDSNALLFEFDNPCKQAIHSFFCPDFLALWLDESGKIVDKQVVTSNKLSIRPQEKFSKLLEVPLNNKYSPAIQFLLEDKNI